MLFLIKFYQYTIFKFCIFTYKIIQMNANAFTCGFYSTYINHSITTSNAQPVGQV